MEENHFDKFALTFENDSVSFISTCTYPHNRYLLIYLLKNVNYYFGSI